MMIVVISGGSRIAGSGHVLVLSLRHLQGCSEEDGEPSGKVGDSSASCRQFVVLLLGARVIRGARVRQAWMRVARGTATGGIPRGLQEKGGHCIQHWRRQGPAFTPDFPSEIGEPVHLPCLNKQGKECGG